MASPRLLRVPRHFVPRASGAACRTAACRRRPVSSCGTSESDSSHPGGCAARNDRRSAWGRNRAKSPIVCGRTHSLGSDRRQSRAYDSCERTRHRCTKIMVSPAAPSRRHVSELRIGREQRTVRAGNTRDGSARRGRRSSLRGTHRSSRRRPRSAADPRLPAGTGRLASDRLRRRNQPRRIRPAQVPGLLAQRRDRQRRIGVCLRPVLARFARRSTGRRRRDGRRRFERQTWIEGGRHGGHARDERRLAAAADR